MDGSNIRHCEAILKLQGSAFLSRDTQEILKAIIADEKKRAVRGTARGQPKRRSLGEKSSPRDDDPPRAAPIPGPTR